MSRTSIARSLGLGAGFLLASAVAASAAPTAPAQQSLPEFNTGRDLKVAWAASSNYTAKSGFRGYQLAVDDLTTGISESVAASGTSKVLPDLFNGHRYRIRVRASERLCLVPFGAGCLAYAPLPSFGPYSDDQQTRIDATDPSGTIEINGGAAFTNAREVRLDLAATDPVSNGYTASGIARMRLGTTDAFPCDPPPLDASGCLTPFGASTSRTLGEGPDGVRTVSAQFEDAAFPANFAVLVGTPSGNLSPVVSDTIILDTTAPSARVTQSSPSIAPGGSLVLSAAASTDGTAGPADSGIDPASVTWQFGDGTTGAGMDVAHTYPTAGTYDGRVSLRDRAGNAASATYRVVVSPNAVVTSTKITSLKRIGRARQFRSVRIAVRTTHSGSIVGSLSTRGKGDAFRIVRQMRKTGGPGLVTLRFSAPKAGRYTLTVRAGSARRTLALRVVR